MTFEAENNVRCTATLGGTFHAGSGNGPLQCVSRYDHAHGHVYVSGSYVERDED